MASTNHQPCFPSAATHNWSRYTPALQLLRLLSLPPSDDCPWGDPTDVSVPIFLGRALLQLGDLDGAREAFRQAAAMPPPDALGDAQATQVQHDLNRALLLVASCEYPRAMGVLKDLMQRAPDDTSVVNNYAMCALYSNNLRTAVDTLEALVRRDPIKHTTEAVLGNLKALYDLSSTNPARKQRVLEALLERYGEDGAQIEAK